MRHVAILIWAGLILVPAQNGARAGNQTSSASKSSLSDDELGHLVNIVRLADQDLDDWSGWEARDQEGMEAYRYQIAFSAYALALQQYNCVPAWREVHKAALDRLLTRMIQKPVWEFWAEVSKTRKDYDPDWEGPKPSKHDPVGEKNIMYSGHIVHMAALYEMFYRDDKWSRPGAMTFRWSAEESYPYDLQKLLGVIHVEMLSPRAKGGACIAGVECEPNLIFPECNQHPLLAFQLNDHNHGTHLYADAKRHLGDFFDCTVMFDPETKNVANCWRVKQAKMVRLTGMPSASADGWTGAFMHSWQPETIQTAYEKQRDRDIRRDPAGELRISFDPAFELGLGFFALLATELGDVKTARELYDYAERHYKPIRDKGTLHYTPNPKAAKDKVSNTSDKVIAMARSNRPNGILNLHERPWSDAEFAYPLVEGIDFPRVLVREARWDADRRTLVVELAPGYNVPDQTSFRIQGIKSGERWTLSRDGKPVGALGPDNTASGAIGKSSDTDAIQISLPLSSRCRLELQRLE